MNQRGASQLLSLVILVAFTSSCGDKKKQQKPDEEDDNPSGPGSSAMSEAKNTVGAISRGAVAAYERETTAGELLSEGDNATAFSHALCTSATPVPADVPKGKEVAVGESDFGGSATAGWKCLKFLLTKPTKWQYTYAKGSGYKSPGRGGKAIEGDSFEACAEGDFKPGGDTTLICQSGTVNPTTRAVRLETELRIFKE